MTHYITLRDADVLAMDEASGNILVSNKKMPYRINEGEKVNIHFTEDMPHIFHWYTIKEIDSKNNIVSLDWFEQIGEDILTEANPLERKLKSADRKLARKQKKIDKKANNLYARDKVDGQDWKFYLELPSGKHLDTPLTYNDVMVLYKGPSLSPSVVNAIVVSENGYIVRKGKFDLHGEGIMLTDSEKEVPASRRQAWTQQTADQFSATLKSLPKDSNLVKVIASELKKSKKKKPVVTDTAPQDLPTEQSPQTNSPATEQPNAATTTEVNDKIVAKFGKLAKAAGIKVVDNNMQPVVNVDVITPATTKDYWIVVNNKEYPLNAWIESAMKSNILTESCDVNNIIVEDVLVEAPVLKLNDADLNNPDRIDLRDKLAQAEEEERLEKEAALAREKEASKRAEEAELKLKYEPFVAELQHKKDTSNDSTDVLQFAFDHLVPSRGAAHTVAGELVRAVMRILYRDYNDGDKFFMGYGLETCGSSAEYLLDHGFDRIETMLEESFELADNDEVYTAAITDLSEDVVNRILEEPQLLWTLNEEDSRDYSYEYIESQQPRFDYSFYPSEDVARLVEARIVNSWDLNDYVESVLSYDSVYKDASVSTPFSHYSTEVEVTNLSAEGYEQLREATSRDGFWEDFLLDYADELADLDADVDDEEDEEDN